MLTRAGNLRKAAPTMARVYRTTFGVSLRDRVAELLATYPDVRSPSWISWEGSRITNAATTSTLKRLYNALED